MVAAATDLFEVWGVVLPLFFRRFKALTLAAREKSEGRGR
jgi:hypothetical protein